MSRRKTHALPPAPHAKRAYAVRSAPLFAHAAQLSHQSDLPAVASSPTTAAAAASLASVAASPAAANSVLASNLSIRPFDIRDSDDEGEAEDVPLAAAHSASSCGKADYYLVQPSAEVRRTVEDPGYSVGGFAPTGWTYTSKLPTRPPQPLGAAERRQWREVAVEDAMRELDLSYGHRMRIKLKRRTLAQLQSVMRSETGEIDRTVLRLCDSGKLSSKVGLYRVVDQRTSVGDRQFTLVTKQPVKQYEPICAVIGTLREHYSYRKWAGGSHTVAMLWAVVVDQGEMPPSYRGPELLLDTAHYSNESRFLRDPTVAHRDMQPNVEARLVWNQREQSINVVYVTLQAMPAGVELWKRWDRKSRELVWECQMRYAARSSHCHWHYIGRLQRLLRENGLDTRPTQLLQTKWTSTESEPQGERKEEAVDKGQQPVAPAATVAESEQKDAEKQPADALRASPSPASSPLLFEQRSEFIPFTWHESRSWTLHHTCAHAVQEATAKENKRLRRQLHLVRQLNRGSGPPVAAEEAAALAAEEEAARLPAYDFEYLADDSVAFAAAECERVTHNDWSSVDAQSMRAVEQSYRRNARDANRLNGDVKAARASGVVSRAAIHRIISLHHPARLYSPPTQPCFALVATAAMRKEACLGAYVGKVRTGEEYNSSTHPYDSVYAYKIGGFDLDLVIDSLHAGNAVRFMNDCFARRGGKLTANVSPRFLFDAVSQRPNCFILVSADKGVKKGEELVTDYGGAYWNRIVRALLKAHGRFGDQARTLIQALKRQIEQAGLTVPAESEWEEVRRCEFREQWVEWPRFEGDADASMDELAQAEDDDDDSGQRSEGEDSQLHSPHRREQSHPQLAGDERMAEEELNTVPAVKVRLGAASGASGLQKVKRHAAAQAKRKRWDEKPPPSSRPQRRQRVSASQAEGVVRSEEAVNAAEELEEEDEGEEEEEEALPSVSVDALNEDSGISDGAAAPRPSAPLDPTAGLAEVINLISSEDDD